MARTANLQNIVDSFLERIGVQVAKGVADGLLKSGLLKRLQKAGKESSSGKPGRKPGRKPGKNTTCSAEGCSLPARAKGLCSKHYQQARYEEKKGANKPAKPAEAGKRGRPPKAAKKVAVEKKAPKRIALKKKAPKKLAPKWAKPAPVVENPALAPESKE